MFERIEWQLAHGRSLALGPQAVIMGILNVTPDSFSDGGRFAGFDAAMTQARRMVEEGAEIVDVGGESTRPGGAAISAAEEQDRVLPVVETIRREINTVISIDTYREETARLAVAAGAHIVNDVWGAQREPAIAHLAAQTGAGMVLMHTGREREKLDDVIDDQYLFLRRSLEIAREQGLAENRILIDPGFGFAKDAEENLSIMARFSQLRGLGRPWMVGASRKRFIGHVTGRESDFRGPGTAASSVILRIQGAAVFRVHDVAINRDALCVADAMIARGFRTEGAGRCM